MACRIVTIHDIGLIVRIMAGYLGCFDSQKPAKVMKESRWYDYRIINDSLSRAVTELVRIVKIERKCDN